MTVKSVTEKSPQYQHNHALGRAGEDRAIALYEERGYTILAHNVSYMFGELDFIAEREGVTVFVEVKTRTTPQWGGAEAVTDHKLRKMRRCANAWLSGRPYGAIRFDVVEVVANSITVYEGIDGGAQ